MKKAFLPFLFILFTYCLYGQQGLLQSGPMLGYNEMKEVLLWAQTSRPATVQFSYWETASPENKYFTEVVMTEKDAAFTAKLVADQVEPGPKLYLRTFARRPTR